ncbi:hypothetical protein KQI88_10380 [Alkaliphilus sp. MSJ-5]|uniref:Uncharacterized protein n=1 Tax=Alkaliphilus flagellatus TaxID=2841507 RepID=A0ABS6G2X0_9FIRM|nr:hypothetical protein [Alkaliphilus flagellatus]MBU5676825.1 hypothetical protein [Alkaliphilus flagellatus]
MLLFLTSNENIGILDFLQDKKNMIIKKLSGEFYLKKFIIHDMKSLDHYSYVVVDLDCLKDSDDDVIEAMEAFRTIYNPRLIIIAKNIENALLSRIVNEAKVYNVITSTDIEKIQEDIRMCLDYEEKFNEQVIKYVKRLNLKYSFTNDNTKIFVAGVKSKFSATKTAINLATFLADIGAKVSYTEANESGYLSRIASYYGFKDSSYKYVEYYYNGNIPLDCNFNIIDIGLLKEKKLKAFNSSDVADIKILCGAAKQSEFEDLANILRGAGEDLNVILSSSSEKEKNSIRKLLKSQKNKIYFTDDSIELFDMKNSNIFMQLLNQYIVENK